VVAPRAAEARALASGYEKAFRKAVQAYVGGDVERALKL
jgi:hypothetical protein